MVYSTQADCLDQISETELVQLTDDAGLGVIDAGVVTRAIADADEEIDGYLGSRMEVPLSPVPGIIRKCSVDIAIYNLYARRQDTAPEIRKDRYKNAVGFLAKVAEGKISLGASDPAGIPSENAAAYTSVDAVMTADKLGRF